MSADETRERTEKSRPLIEDIRLLGRVLGEVIREQEGAEMFDLVERIRQLSVAFRLKDDTGAGRRLDELLKGLSDRQTVRVIRAFSYFSHLANTAEDRHMVRRREHHDRLGHLREGSLAMALKRLAEGNVAHAAARPAAFKNGVRTLFMLRQRGRRGSPA